MSIKKADIVETIRTYGLDVTSEDIKHTDEQTRLGFKDILTEDEATVWKNVLKDKVCLKVNDGAF